MSFQQIVRRAGSGFVVEIGRGNELGCRPMASVVSREAYFETGLEALDTGRFASVPDGD